MDLKIKNFSIITLTKIHQKERGSLCVGEIKKEVPFDIKRFYVIYNTPEGAMRGAHAHINTEQVLFCVSGSIKVLLADGKNKGEIILDDPCKGVLLGKMLWHEIVDFKKDTVLLVLASDFYKEEDYLRSYESFIQRL